MQIDGASSMTFAGDGTLEVFTEFENDIHRIAQREFVERLGGKPPILLTSVYVEG